jgi:hypothetical protein
MNWPAFVENWRDCWKWISFQCAAATGSASMAFVMLPSDWKTPFVVNCYATAIAVVSYLGNYGRLIQQTPQPPKAEADVSK